MARARSVAGCECSRAWGSKLWPLPQQDLTSGPLGKFYKLLLSVQFSNIKYLHNVVRPLVATLATPRETLYPKTIPIAPAPPPEHHLIPLAACLYEFVCSEASRKWHRTWLVLLLAEHRSSFRLPRSHWAFTGLGACCCFHVSF